VPSHRIAAQEVTLNVFDVVGQDGDRRFFIAHSGLAIEQGPHVSNDVAVVDMGPPLHAPNEPNRIQANALGAAGLDHDEVQKIRTFVDQHLSEHEAFRHLSQRQILRLAPQMYCIYPHSDPVREADGRYSRMRFSCSGFVFEAYLSAGIILCTIEGLPRVEMEVIMAAYPQQARLMESERVTADSLGLKESGPWPVLLCGYLFHALNRPPSVIRAQAYAPVAGDEFFPSSEDQSP
jgi:hypothetical protein